VGSASVSVVAVGFMVENWTAPGAVRNGTPGAVAGGYFMWWGLWFGPFGWIP
jgi:hypothetical protein